jgi:hypothetical protein
MRERRLESLRVRDRLTIFTPLGIRFWDPALDIQVNEGLTVTARPLDSRSRTTSAFRTTSGIYAFQGLPGLRAVEYPLGQPLPERSPPATTRFLVEARDEMRRFLPVAFAVSLPYPGIFPTGSLHGLPAGGPPGFYLFAAPTRPVPATLAVVRAQLVEHGTGSREKAARHAVMEVQGPDGQIGYGLSDERGCATVLFPYPTFSSHSGAVSLSPPGTDGRQRWTLSIGIRYAPDALRFAPASSLPELRSIFNQGSGTIWPGPTASPEQPVSRLSAELIFGEELVLKSAGEATLLISPALSSPSF